MPRSKSKKNPSKNKAATKSKSKAKSSDSYDSNDSECCDDDDDDDDDNEDMADINNDSDEGEEETETTTTSYSSKTASISKKKENNPGNKGYCCYDTNYNDNDNDNANDNCNCVCDSENAGTSNRDEYYRPCLDLPSSCCQNRVNFKLPCGFSAGCKNYQNNQNNQRNFNFGGNDNVNFSENNPAKKIPPCYPTCCQPKAYWEREIVKFNPGGKWNPQIEEKGETGRPNLFPDKNKNKNRSKDKDRKGRKRKGCGKDKSEMDEEDQPVALGEPCNAYRCYKDPCLPSGLAYCTPKHPRPSPIPPCPEKFPIKPRRIAICPQDQDPVPGQREAAVASGLPPGVAEALGPAFLQGYGLSSKCRENRRNANRARNVDMGMGFQGQGQFPGQSQDDDCCPQDRPQIYNDFPTNSTLNGKKRKIPDEWIQVLPLCDPCKPPKSKKKKGGKSKSKSGDSSTCCSYDDE